MLTLLRNVDVFTPAPAGVCDLLVAGGRVAALAPSLPEPPGGWPCDVVDLQGARVIPGLVDAHVHVTGGGGEAGPSTRVPPLGMSTIARAGVTSVVGLLGTDGTTRTMRELVARTYGLREEGLSAWCWTGSYQVPPVTLTGAVRDDIAFIDPVIGVGEVALSDHRSSQPTFDELVRLAADAHVGGLMTGKAGVLHLHLGDGLRGLSLVRRALDETELPPRVFHPTHVNRQRRLLTEAQELSSRGVTVDVTAYDGEDDGVSAADAIAEHLGLGLPPERITCSSDGGGCIPTFGPDGRVTHMDVGRSAALLRALRELLERGVALHRALPPFTCNVADALRLPRKGRIALGFDADLVALDSAGAASWVMARGRWLVREGNAVVVGPFEGRDTP